MTRLLRPTTLVLLGALLALASAQAQPAPVLVQLAPPAPNQLTLADAWRVTLTNTGRASVEVFLLGTVEEAEAGLVAEGRSRTLALPPGATRTTAAQLEPIDVDYADRRYETALLRTGAVPSGEYTVCAVVIEAATDFELGRDCFVQLIQQVTPPELLAPDPEATVSERTPVFTWTPPAPLPTRTAVTYRIKVVRVLGRQSPLAAVRSNPAWYEADRLPMTTLSYPLGARPFEAGTYAWVVGAFRADGTPLAESEVGVFQWQPGLVATRPQRPGGLTGRPQRPEEVSGVRAALLGACGQGSLAPGAPGDAPAVTVEVRTRRGG